MPQTDAGGVDLERLFERLARSPFRASFRLKGRELRYLHDRGLPEVLEHAGRFIADRLAPAEIPNDGRQTPFRNHPVFVAQHATATCCRGCLAKWHRIPAGHELSEEEQAYVIGVIARWLRSEDV